MWRALITGGAGFVGRHFARRLLDDGWHVTVIDDLSAGIEPPRWAFQPKSMDALGYYPIDLRVFVKLDKFDPASFDLIIHCAAVVGGRLKIEGDPIAVATDLAIDADLFQWIVKARRMPKVIYFSSSAVYPAYLQQRSYDGLKMAESLVTFTERIGIPDMTYGWAKLTGEFLAQHAVKTYNADIIIYRPFSGYGEDQSFDYPFPSIIKRVVDGEDPVIVWGSGEQCRDFIHIDDVVEAVMQTKDVLKPGEVLNLGSGNPISFRQLAVMAGAAITLNDHTKPEGVFYRVADTYKLSQLYTPKISLEEGIRRVAKHLTESKKECSE